MLPKATHQFLLITANISERAPIEAAFVLSAWYRSMIQQGGRIRLLIGTSPSSIVVLADNKNLRLNQL
jgi:hypothetical protein